MPTRFIATSDQIKDLASVAVRASEVVGMGILQASPSDSFYPDDFEPFFNNDGGFGIDYYKGRMVKLYVKKIKKDTEHGACLEWEFSRNPDPEYQSWCKEYRTNKALIEASGCIFLSEAP